MKKLNQLTATCALVFIGLLFLPKNSAHATIATGSYSVDFGSETPLWDISGSYSGGNLYIKNTSTDGDSNAATIAIANLNINEDASGKLKGTVDNMTFSNFNTFLSGSSMTVTGVLKTTGTVTHVALVVSGSGTGTTQSHQVTIDVSFSEVLKFNCDIDGTGKVLSVTGGSATAKLKSLTDKRKLTATMKISSGDAFPLPSGADGHWSLALDLTPAGVKYSGSASALTSPGLKEDLKATGTYAPRKNLSTISLKGKEGNLNLLLSSSGSAISVDKATGKLFGQTLKYIKPTP